MQFKELLLRDILLVLRYAEQDEEQGLFCVCLVQPLQPLLDDGEVVRHNGGPDELVARLLDLLIEGELFRDGEVFEQGVDVPFQEYLSLLLQGRRFRHSRRTSLS